MHLLLRFYRISYLLTKLIIFPEQTFGVSEGKKQAIHLIRSQCTICNGHFKVKNITELL